MTRPTKRQIGRAPSAATDGIHARKPPARLRSGDASPADLRSTVGNQAMLGLLRSGAARITSGGKPLDVATRMGMEQQFHYDFSRVRLHDDRASNAEAKRLGARAFTVGWDIVLARGASSSNLAVHQRLLTHELTHVVQQTAYGAPGATSSAAEAEASTFEGGRPGLPQARVVPGIQRQPQAKGDDREDWPTVAEIEAWKAAHPKEAAVIEGMPYSAEGKARRYKDEIRKSRADAAAKPGQQRSDSVAPSEPYSGPAIGPLNEPHDRRRRTIIVRGADITGLDPLVKETREVWATPEEAEEMEAAANSEFHGRVLAAAVAGAPRAGSAQPAIRPSPPARGQRRPSAARTAQDARAAGLVDMEEGRLGLQSHSTARTVRDVEGTSGATHQSAHIVPQAVYRRLGRSPGRALTLNLPTEIHTKIDQAWVSKWNSAVKNGQKVTAGDVYHWMSDAIKQVPDTELPPKAKGTLQWRLELELKELGLEPDTPIVEQKSG